MSENKEAPATIYLQDGDEYDDGETRSDYEGITWCADSINDGDTKYIRFDLHESALAQRQKVIDELVRLEDLKAELDAMLTEIRHTPEVREYWHDYRTNLPLAWAAARALSTADKGGEG